MPNTAKFAQRKIKATYGSFRSRTPLRTPSGPQFTESALESELLDQLHFTPSVTDLVTQAIIEYQHGAETRTYATDIVATLAPSLGHHPTAYIIEVKRQGDIAANHLEYRRKFAAARSFAQQRGAAFRVLTEAEIRTPYLANARLLAPWIGVDMDEEVLDQIRRPLLGGGTTVAALTQTMIASGHDAPSATTAVEQSIALRLVDVDLAAPLDAMTVVAYEPGNRRSGADDPILRTLLMSDRADRIIDGDQPPSRRDAGVR